MYYRYYVAQIAAAIHEMNAAPPDYLAVDFFKQWLVADPKIFIYEHNWEWAHPELFFQYETPAEKLRYGAGRPMAYERELDRLSAYDLLTGMAGKNCALERLRNEVTQKIQSDNEDVLYPELSDSISVKHFTKKQLCALNRISVHASLVLRFCREHWGAIPLPFLYHFEDSRKVRRGRGWRKGEKPKKKECMDQLQWLINAGLYSPVKGGSAEAADLINEILPFNRDAKSIYGQIRFDHDSLIGSYEGYPEVRLLTQSEWEEIEKQ